MDAISDFSVALLSEVCDYINSDVLLNSLRYDRRVDNPKWRKNKSFACLEWRYGRAASGCGLEPYIDVGCFLPCRFMVPVSGGLPRVINSQPRYRVRVRLLESQSDSKFMVECDNIMFDDVRHILGKLSADIQHEYKSYFFCNFSDFDPIFVSLHDEDFLGKIVGALRFYFANISSALSKFGVVL